MKFRFLVAALAIVLGGAAFFGARATTTQAAAGPDIQLTCPFIVTQSSPFSCVIGLGATTDAMTGFQFTVIYNSFTGPSGTPSGTGTAMNVTSFTPNYTAAVLWGGGEFCNPDPLNVPSPLLPTGYEGAQHGCVSLAGPAPLAAIPTFVTINLVTGPAALGTFPLHMVTLGGGGPTFGSFTIDGASAPHTNLYKCLGTVCAPTPFSTPDNLTDPIINIVQSPPDVTVTKVGSSASIVQGQPFSWTITVTNTSTTTPAPAVNVTDTLPGAYTATSVVPTAGTCAAANTAFPCSLGTLAPLATVTINVSGTMTGGAGTTVQNCASETNSSVPTDPAPANNTNRCASVTVIPPAVAWKKVGDNAQTFLCEAGTIGVQGCTADGKNGNVSFEEVMTNQGDPNGLAAFEFTLHFDNLIFDVPVICSSRPGPEAPACPATGSYVDIEDAASLLLAGGRTSVSCTMSLPQETQIHVACASTGPIGVGPVFIGDKDMADVRLHIKDNVRGALFPTKENGIVTRVDDTGTELANTCGQPLNDGTGFVVPGQTTECQGVPLLGILPGGLVADSHLFITIRRLEGDVTKDCSVTVADMQAEATRYGFGFGSLLYQIWFDLEPHTTGADGDIDIKDVQFVFGRFGSECDAPIPPQVPQTPVDP